LAITAAYMMALTDDDPTMLTDGIAKLFALATLKMYCKSVPETTPGFTTSAILFIMK